MPTGTEAVLEKHRPSSPGYAKIGISKKRLSRPQSVRISSASLVPFSSVRFRLKGADKEEIQSYSGLRFRSVPFKDGKRQS